jgi:thioredoxin 1
MGRVLLYICVFLVLSSCAKDEDTGNGSLVDITSKSQFETTINSGVSVVFFHATWCPKCKDQRPAVEGLTTESELKDVKFGQVDYEKVKDVVTEYGVLGFPTILIFKNSVEVGRFENPGHSQKTLSDKVKSLL